MKIQRKKYSHGGMPRDPKDFVNKELEEEILDLSKKYNIKVTHVLVKDNDVYLDIPEDKNIFRFRKSNPENQEKFIEEVKNLVSKKTYSKGGMLVGKSHEKGGIEIKTPEGKIEAEGGEIIINKKSSQKYCEQLSKINEAEGGVKIPCASNGMKIDNVTYNDPKKFFEIPDSLKNKNYEILKSSKKESEDGKLKLGLRIFSLKPNSLNKIFKTGKFILVEDSILLYSKNDTPNQNEIYFNNKEEVFEAYNSQLKRNKEILKNYFITGKPFVKSENKDQEYLQKTLDLDLFKQGGKINSEKEMKNKTSSFKTLSISGNNHKEIGMLIDMMNEGWKIVNNTRKTIQLKSPNEKSSSDKPDSDKACCGRLLKKGGKIWERLDFSNIEEYFDYINESLINGNRSQTERLYEDMSEDQKRQFFDYGKNTGGFEEVFEFINTYVRKFKKGGSVKSKKWIQSALSGEKGKLRAVAKRQGLISGNERLSKTDIKKLEKSPNPTTRKRAKLAETLMGFNKKFNKKKK